MKRASEPAKTNVICPKCRAWVEASVEPIMRGSRAVDATGKVIVLNYWRCPNCRVIFPHPSIGEAHAGQAISDWREIVERVHALDMKDIQAGTDITWTTEYRNLHHDISEALAAKDEMLCPDCGANLAIEHHKSGWCPSLGVLPSRQLTDYPDPTPDMLNGDPLFEAIWLAIKGWDFSRHGNGVYSGATGNDARHIYDAIKSRLARA